MSQPSRFDPESPMTVVNEDWGIIAVPDTPEVLAGAGITVPDRLWPEYAWSPTDRPQIAGAPPPHNRLVLALAGRVPNLTFTEREVMKQRADGLREKEIATSRGCDLDTVKSHVGHAISVTSSQNSAQVITKMILSGDILLRPDKTPTSLPWRDVGILLLVACGVSNKRIAPSFGYTSNTGISKPLAAASAKLNFVNRYNAVLQAFNSGVLIMGQRIAAPAAPEDARDLQQRS